MRFGSVCSGIEAATMAWGPLGWTPAWYCEIDPFASAVLAHHHPSVPNYGNFTTLLDPNHPVHRAPPLDVLVGGTPCQDFSVAGLRAGIDGDRGNLALEFCRLVGVLRPKWVVWENVPGVLSSDGGRALGAFLGALGDLGVGWAYRCLDAQFFGLAQRRKRVFVVGCAGGQFERAAAVLFEPEGVRRDSPPRRRPGQDTASALGTGASRGGGGQVGADIAEIEQVMAFDYKQSGADATVEASPPLRATPHHASHANEGRHIGVVHPTLSFKPGQSEAAGGTFVTEEVTPTLQGTNNGSTAVPAVCVSTGDRAPIYAFKASHFTRGKDGAPSEVVPPLSADADKGDQDTPIFTGDGVVADPVSANEGKTYTHEDNTFRLHNCVLAPTLTATNDPSRSPQSSEITQQVYAVYQASHAVRRLTPRECERLQGFPDDSTLIPFRGKPAADANRYKALGNSMAVPVMRWIGERIATVEQATLPLEDTPHESP